MGDPLSDSAILRVKLLEQAVDNGEKVHAARHGELKALMDKVDTRIERLDAKVSREAEISIGKHARYDAHIENCEAKKAREWMLAMGVVLALLGAALNWFFKKGG